MKITSVRAFLLSYPFAQPIELDYFGGHRTIFKRDAMLIRIETDKGIIGYAPGQATERAASIVHDVVSPFLVGRELGDPDALRILFSKSSAGDELLNRTYYSVEIALYDALGKARGLPVSELIGGRVRDRMRLYGSAGMYMTPDKYAEEAAAIAKLGFRAYKMRPGLGPERDVETVRLVREAVGSTFDLMIDAHTWWRMGDNSYSAETVERIAGQLAEYEIAWLEEPLPPHDHEAYLKLKQADLVPIASGEHEPNELSYIDLIQNDCVDFVHMDVACQGGYPTARRIMPEIAAMGMKFAFHCWGTALEVVAAAHLGICWPDSVVEWLEYPCYSTATLNSMYPFPLAADILKDPVVIEEGDIIVSRAPGLGVEVDETVIDRYPWKPGPWSSFSTTSPKETFTVTGDHSTKWAER